MLAHECSLRSRQTTGSNARAIWRNAEPIWHSRRGGHAATPPTLRPPASMISEPARRSPVSEAVGP